MACRSLEKVDPEAQQLLREMHATYAYILRLDRRLGRMRHEHKILRAIVDLSEDYGDGPQKAAAALPQSP